MLFKLPMVVAYKMSKLSAFIGRALTTSTSFWAFPNILCKKEIVKEVIQDDCTVDSLYDGVKQLFDDQERNREMIEEFTIVHRDMMVDTDEKIIEVIDEMLNNN